MTTSEPTTRLSKAREVTVTIPACNRDNMLLWILGLESGKFQQGRDLLEQTLPDGVVKHCCLGVACRIAMDNGVDLVATPLQRRSVHEETVYTSFRVPDNHATHTFLPSSVAAWLGIASPSLIVVDPALTESIDDDGLTAVRLNDGYQLSFPQIAVLLRVRFDIWDDLRAKAE